MTAPAALDVVVRCRNEMPYARETLLGLRVQQGVVARVLFLDCGSTDGSREEAEKSGAEVRPIVPSEYIPGAVLNLGMRSTKSPLVAFVNADAIPLTTDALAKLLAPFSEGKIAATFARQLARKGADRLTRFDYARAFGDQPVQMQHGTFFSMAASAIRREVWSALPFDERLRYSEDADWTQRARALGWQIAYVPESKFEHSHAYDLRGQLKRRSGEGAADTAIFRLGHPSPVRELVRPLLGTLARDLRAGVATPQGALVRAAQIAGRFNGRRADAKASYRSAAQMQNGAAKRETEAAKKETEAAEKGEARLTFSGEPEAERNIGAILEQVREKLRAALGTELRTLALVGSYARGEGGAVAREGKLGPYNDLDLLAAVKKDAKGWRKKLHPLCAEMSRELAIEIDVWPIDEGFLAEVPRTLFWLDIARGGRRILEGDSAAFDQLTLTPREVPLDEAGRLLANRATGIALSNLEGGEEPMARHIHKAALACGDSLLLAADRYAPTLRARLKELETLRDSPAIGAKLVARYADALNYRERPDLWDPLQSRAEWYREARAEIAGWHFAFEKFRRGAPSSPLEFANWTGRVYAELPDVRKGGALFASVRAAALGQFPLLPFLGHPRERLARASVALAYGSDDPRARAAACQLLGIASIASDAAVALRLRELTARAG